MAVTLSPLIFGCEGLQLTSKEIDFFAESRPFGFILFSRNLESPSQINDLCNELRLAVGWHVPIMIDQEGGRVSRLTAPHWFEFPPALDHADHINSERLFWLRGRLIAENLYSCGIDTNCAPLGDIAGPTTHLVLKNRCYGFDKAAVIANALALDAGQRAGGVSGVLKHIPGHGRAEQDSHITLPVVSDKQAELSNTDFDVFRHLTSINMGMTAHLVFQDIDTTAPATHSEAMVGLIRSDIGFDGLLMTDDITMNALKGDVVQRAEKAWAVGCDIVLHCNGNFEQMYNLVASSGPLTDETKRRMDQVIANRPNPIPVDILQLKEEFDVLINE